MKSQTPSNKLQTNLKFQYSMTKTGLEFLFLQYSSTYTLTSQELTSAKSTLEALQERVIIKEGDAERLAGMMVANGDLYSGSLELLADPDWSGSLVMPA